MTEIIWHGRGGQGAFTASKILGAAYTSLDKHFALSFPSFGPERRGAPVKAFTKLSLSTIGDRSQIQKADYIIFLDGSLFNYECISQLKPGGKVIINTSDKKICDDDRREHLILTNATDTAMKVLKKPIVNTVMLGTLCAISGIFEDYFEEALRAGVETVMPSALREKNIKAIISAYEGSCK